VRYRRAGLTGRSTPLLLSAVFLLPFGYQTARADDAASANTQSGSGVEEIIVTAARRDTNSSAGTKTNTPLIATAQSLTVIPRDLLDLQNPINLNEALRFTAGISPETRGATATRYDQLNIRGFTPPEYLDGMRLMGGLYYATPQIDLDLLDRIEVVKGPSSVLYGQTSPGGLINLASKLPTLDPHGEVSLTGGNFNLFEGMVDVGGPIDPNGEFLYRFVGMGSMSDGQVRTTENRRYAISPSFTWAPDEDTSWTVLIDYQRDPKAASYGSVPPVGSVFPNPHGQVPVDFYDGDQSFERFDRTQTAISSFFVHRFDGDWTFKQNMRFLRTTTLYKSVYFSYLAPNDITAHRGVAYSDESANAFTLDNQLSGQVDTGPVSHELLFGVDYQRDQSRLEAGFGYNGFFEPPPIDLYAPDNNMAITAPPITIDSRTVQQQTGLYGQDQIKVGNWIGMLSGRYDWYDARTFDEPSHTTADDSETDFTGRVALLYVFDNGFSPYVSYSTSFEPQTSTDYTGKILKPTEGDQVELGLKYQPKGIDGLITASLYDIHQTNVATRDPAHPAFGSIAAGEVRSRGIELEGRVKLTPGFEVLGSYTYLDNMVTKDDSGLQGTRPYGIPRQTASVWGIYTIEEGPFSGLGFGGGVRYIGQSYDGDGAYTIPSTALVDAVVKYDFSYVRPTLQGLNLTVNVTNLGDEKYVSSCYYTTWCWYGSQRTVRADLRYSW
jgi:iron complex outermembrane receptor protein